MGLDWMLQNKPRDNADDKEEYYKLKYKLKLLKSDINYEIIDDTYVEMEQLEEQLNNISISPNETAAILTENEIDILNDCIVGGSFVSKDYDFRGKVIGRADLLDEELQMEAYENHTAEECIEYAIKLELYIQHLNRDDLDENDQEDYDYLIKAIKWLKFWGFRGHGYYASY